MTPSPKTARRVKAPPENRFKNPSTPLDDAFDCSKATCDQLTPGMGKLAPNWYRQIIAMVNRTLLRRSGTRKMFERRRSTDEPYRFWCWLPAAGGRTLKGRSTTVTVPPAASMAALADAEKPCADTCRADVSSPRPR